MRVKRSEITKTLWIVVVSKLVDREKLLVKYNELDVYDKETIVYRLSHYLEKKKTLIVEVRVRDLEGEEEEVEIVDLLFRGNLPNNLSSFYRVNPEDSKALGRVIDIINNKVFRS